ncbi:MAG: zinc-binding dehydrogenase [Chloroflexi bacterium]|nr:zinc-binding dehydrogenase [Chloroflexota bacterium]
MRALVNYAGTPGAVEVRRIAEPTIGAAEVLLRSRGIGVCGSDLHQWHATQSWKVNWPVTLGHEFCGEVEAVGSAVRGFKVGDRVTCETAAYVCGVCPMCRIGHYNLCPERLGFGYGVDGAAADYVKAEARLLHHIPDGVTWEQAAITEPCCVAFNAVVEKSHPRPGQTAVVLGPGPIGLLALQMLRTSGPTRLVMVGLVRDGVRLELARRFGADEVIESDRYDAVQQVLDMTDGLGADLVIDAAGISATLRQALAMVRPEGQVTKIGWGPQPFGYSLDPLVAKAVTLQGSFSHNWTTWEAVLQLMSTQRLDLDPFLNIYPLEDWRQAFERMDRLEVPKVILRP